MVWRRTCVSIIELDNQNAVCLPKRPNSIGQVGIIISRRYHLAFCRYRHRPRFDFPNQCFVAWKSPLKQFISNKTSNNSFNWQHEETRYQWGCCPKTGCFPFRKNCDQTPDANGEKQKAARQQKKTI